MNLSAKTEYACIAILELANQHGSGGPIRLRRIAETHGIPSPFLVQIMLQLKAAGLVESTRGASGGYQLSRDPSQITLAEVREIVEGSTSGMVTSNLADTTSVTAALLAAWRQASAAEREVLAEITFAQLVDQVRDPTEKMYYI